MRFKPKDLPYPFPLLLELNEKIECKFILVENKTTKEIELFIHPFFYPLLLDKASRGLGNIVHHREIFWSINRALERDNDNYTVRGGGYLIVNHHSQKLILYRKSDHYGPVDDHNLCRTATLKLLQEQKLSHYTIIMNELERIEGYK